MSKLACAAIAAALIGGAAFADETCLRPADPNLPVSGADLTSDELDAAADEVVAWSNAMRAYAACLNTIIADRDAVSAEEWASALNRYNAINVIQTDVWNTYQALADEWWENNEVRTASAE